MLPVVKFRIIKVFFLSCFVHFPDCIYEFVLFIYCCVTNHSKLSGFRPISHLFCLCICNLGKAYLVGTACLLTSGMRWGCWRKGDSSFPWAVIIWRLAHSCVCWLMQAVGRGLGCRPEHLCMTSVFHFLVSLQHVGWVPREYFNFVYLFLAALSLGYCVWAFSSCSEWGLLCSCCAWASNCGSFSCCRAQALAYRLSSCGVWD